jgi:TolA-binding protein
MRPLLACLPISALAVMLSANASAQTTLDGRVNRLEQEMRAVQRKVFPEGAGRLVQPELSAPQTSATPVGTPATSPVADLEARVSAIEAQLRSLTGQVEQGNFKLRQLEDAFTKFKTDAQAQSATAPAPAPAAMAPPAKPASPGIKTAAVAGKQGAGALLPDARKMAVAAIEKPETGNDADDAYTYGYRLWAAKFYPEAQVQLKTTVDQYGNASIASRAQNLLGRAYLDDGKPALASVAFYENYKTRPKGDRAAESLAYLGEALIRIKKLPDACKVYEELGDVYGASLNASLRDMMEKGKLRAKCSV